MYPKLSSECTWCDEWRKWNEEDTERCQRSGLAWTVHVSEVVLPKCQEMLAHCRRYHPEPKPAKQYAFTFTTNMTKEEIQDEMCDSAYKLFSQNTVPVRVGEAYLEYTEEGRPHIHGWYETQDGGRIFAKVFRRCWKYWGEKDKRTKFAGGYHEEMKSNRYKGYASSEGRLIVMKKEDAEGAHLFYEQP